MDELIRRALLGDQNAQRECTEKGIVLGCPRCGKGGASTQYVMGDYWYECPHCHSASGFHSSAEVALADWNTRPAPPIGRCGKCAWYVPGFESEVGHIPSNCTHPLTELYVINEDDYCSYFEPKGDDNK